MADYSITAANVLRSNNSTLETGIVSSSGSPVAIARTAPLIYQLPDGTWQPAIANGAAPAYKSIAWALNDAAPGQDFSFVRSDTKFKPGFTLAVHEIAVLSWGAAGQVGKLADIAGLPSGAYLTIVLVGIGANYATLCIVNVNAPKP
jgi:hypothetical protein